MVIQATAKIDRFVVLMNVIIKQMEQAVMVGYLNPELVKIKSVKMFSLKKMGLAVKTKKENV